MVQEMEQKMYDQLSLTIIDGNTKTSSIFDTSSKLGAVDLFDLEDNCKVGLRSPLKHVLSLTADTEPTI